VSEHRAELVKSQVAAISSAKFLSIVGISLALLPVSYARATGEATVTHMRSPPPIAKDIESLPRLVSGAKPSVMQRINAVLSRGDAWARRALSNCKRTTVGDGDVVRNVSVEMRGPNFVSFVAADAFFCGGAHPSFSRTPFVFDLRTGAPVDWVTTLPGLGLRKETEKRHDLPLWTSYASERLSMAYKDAWKRSRSGPGKDAKLDERDSDCMSALDDEPLQFIFWLNRGEGGVIAEPSNLPHAVRACGDALPIPRDLLKADGADPRLLQAIEPVRGPSVPK